MTPAPAPAAAPAVAVIVVNYRAGRYLGRCLEALARQRFRDFEVIVADNASGDGSLEAVEPLPAGFRSLRLPANLGFAAANNQAAALTAAPWLATLNPDAFPDENWLAELMAATRRYPDVVMFGSTQIAAETPDLLDGAGDVCHVSGLAWRHGHRRPLAACPPEGEAFSPCAAAALYRREAFLAAGGFDARFFCYNEDVDLGFRLRLRGERCIQVRAARVLHVGSGITGARSAFAAYHSTRNLVWTLVKNMPGPLLPISLPLHLAAQALRLGLALARGLARPTLRGLADGLSGIGPVLAERRRLQAGRRASTCAIARALTWSPAAPFLSFLRRRVPTAEARP